jgi:hypothetical protein
MNFNFHKSVFEERRVRLSVLRAAYLLGVAITGYQLIPVWNAIRLQILNPETSDASLAALVKYEHEHPRDRRTLGAFATPAEARGFLIGFGRWTAFLPLDRDSILFRPDELRGRSFSFTGHSYAWPTTPSFGLEP